MKHRGGELLTLKVYSIEEEWSLEERPTSVSEGPGIVGTETICCFSKKAKKATLRLPSPGPFTTVEDLRRDPPRHDGFGDRIAYVENDNKKVLHVTTTGDKAVDRILTLEGLLDALTWSL
jgi:hypothetical protein